MKTCNAPLTIIKPDAWKNAIGDIIEQFEKMAPHSGIKMLEIRSTRQSSSTPSCKPTVLPLPDHLHVK